MMKSPVKGMHAAPMIYFDAAATYGVFNNVGEIELVARVICPNGEGGTTTDLVATAHLRGSLEALSNLHQAIGSAFKMAGFVPPGQSEGEMSPGEALKARLAQMQ